MCFFPISIRGKEFPTNREEEKPCLAIQALRQPYLLVGLTLQFQNVSGLSVWLIRSPLLAGPVSPPRLLYECPKCPSIFSSFVELAKHQRAAHTDPPFKPESGGRHACPDCGTEFANADDMRTHRVLMHSPAFGQDKGELLGLIHTLWNTVRQNLHFLFSPSDLFGTYVTSIVGFTLS